MAKKREPHLQKIADDKYIVRVGTQRMGQVIQSEGKWYQFCTLLLFSKQGYDTREQAVKELIQPTTAQLKKPDYPRIHFRLSQERIEWFRDYAKRGGKSMSSIIKEYIEKLYQQDLQWRMK